MFAGLVRNRVQATLVPGVAAADPTQGQPASAQQPEPFDRGNRVLGTSGRETAMVSQPGADYQTVAFNECQDQCAHGLQLYASGFPVRCIAAGC